MLARIAVLVHALARVAMLAPAIKCESQVVEFQHPLRLHQGGIGDFRGNSQ
jgi:hypothetical protein